jgi:BirA family biotin operon repressor/biotin-[acetyl-CoA-carboxylase] ligase
MDIELWRERLEQLPLGELYLYQELGSTNQVAEELIHQGAPQFSLVLADSQTMGKGRQGRTWVTRPGKALAFSLIIYPQKGSEPDWLGMLSGLGALALTEALNDEYRLPAQIKWPNDVLVEGKKVAGVLVELHWTGPELQAAVIGVGVNVHRGSAPDSFLLNFPAGSLEELGGGRISRLDLLIHTLKGMLSWYLKIEGEEFLSRWDNYLAFKGEKVMLMTGGRVLDHGELIGLADSGCLVLKSEAGEERVYGTGEIQLRPVDRS